MLTQPKDIRGGNRIGDGAGGERFKLVCMKKWKVFGAVAALAAMAACLAQGGAGSERGCGTAAGAADSAASAAGPQLAILDTDIGDDIDDAFALALVLRKPGDQAAGDYDGIRRHGTASAAGGPVSGRGWAERYSGGRGQADAALERVYAGGVCRAGAGPKARGWSPVSAGPDPGASGRGDADCHWTAGECGAAIERDPATFRKLKRVVMMGGSIYRGYDHDGQTNPIAGRGVEHCAGPGGSQGAAGFRRAGVHDAAGFDADPPGGTGAGADILLRVAADRPIDAALSPVGRAQRDAQPDADALRPGGSDVCGAAGRCVRRSPCGWRWTPRVSPGQWRERRMHRFASSRMRRDFWSFCWDALPRRRRKRGGEGRDGPIRCRRASKTFELALSNAVVCPTSLSF